MSLLDSLLLDPFALDVWVAPRTDGVRGSGTEDDPYDGSLRTTTVIAVSSITSGGTVTASVTTSSNHGFQSGQAVQISGVTGPLSSDTFLYNGTFLITVGSSTTFSYLMTAIPSGAASGTTITCQADPCFFDNVMRALPATPPVAVRLGPGLFQTKGYTVDALAAWVPHSGMKILGSGMEVTIVQLMGAFIDNTADYAPISGPYNNYTDSFEASDFTVDCNIAGQISKLTACGAIGIVGKHTRIRRIRAINFGTQTTTECFVLFAAGAHPLIPECFDCWIADCIVEQPGLNGNYVSTLISMSASDGGSVLAAYHRACVIRNCFVDTEFRQNPAPILSISNGGSGSLFTVTTRLPHGHASGDWVRITGAAVAGSTSNSFNGSYQISAVTALGFQYTPSPAQTTNPDAGADMWLGRFPSHWVNIIGITGPVGTGPYTFTIQTGANHYLTPQQIVNIINVANISFDSQFPVTAVSDPTHFQIQFSTNPGLPTLTGNEFLGVEFHALSGDLGTAAVVEGNRTCNVTIGGTYHDTYNSRDMIVRNNYHRAILLGCYEFLETISGPTPSALSNITWSGGLATVTTPTAHGLIQGDAVEITGTVPTQYSGNFTVTSVTATTFTYSLATSPGLITNNGSCRRMWQTDRLVFENNQFELIPTPENYEYPVAILFGYAIFADPPLFQQAVMRRNCVRHVDGTTDSDGTGKAAIAVSISGCGNLVVEENVVDLQSTTPIEFSLCSNTKFFANQTPTGALIQGFNGVTSVDELSTAVEDAAALAF